ncbi:MAG: glycosyltransferase family 2 protein [Lachnospiraceae bacterium]
MIYELKGKEEVTDMEIVSVIVPVYNVERYLKECVDSLLRQTYKNLEIILVDDGSQDSSGEICDEYLHIDKRVKVIHKENAGLGFARNSGLEIATGRFVTFIDSDDIADLNLVELLMEGIEECGADTCIGGFKRVDETGKTTFTEQYTQAVYTGEAVYDGLFARMLGSAPDRHDSIRMSVWNVMYSMDIIKQHSLRFPSEREFISEDIIWDSEYYKYADCVKVITSTAYSYRITPGSLTKKYKPQMLEMICTLYKEMENRLNGDVEKTTRLQRQFFVNLRMCISQENNHMMGQRETTLRKRLEDIVSCSTVEKVVNTYPIERTQFQARMFLIIIKYKLVTVMGVLLKLGMI